ETLCAELSPAWASAGHSAEYWAKVMSDAPRVEALGRDFGRFLPGVFWLNFFGRPYRELLGDDRLRSTPAARVAIVDDGVLVGLAGEGWPGRDSEGSAEPSRQAPLARRARARFPRQASIAGATRRPLNRW